MSLHEDEQILNELNDTTNEKKMLDYKTSLAKTHFINEIKNGLGDEIKSNGSKIKIIKPSIWKKMGNIIKKIFTGF